MSDIGAKATADILSRRNPHVFLFRNLHQVLQLHKEEQDDAHPRPATSQVRKEDWIPPHENDIAKYNDTFQTSQEPYKLEIHFEKITPQNRREQVPRQMLACDVNIDVSIRETFTEVESLFKTVSVQLQGDQKEGTPRSLFINQREQLHAQLQDFDPPIWLKDMKHGKNYDIRFTIRLEDRGRQNMLSIMRSAGISFPGCEEEVPTTLIANGQCDFSWVTVARGFQNIILPLYYDPATHGSPSRPIGLLLKAKMCLVPASSSVLEALTANGRGRNNATVPMVQALSRRSNGESRWKYEIKFHFQSEIDLGESHGGHILMSLVCMHCRRKDFLHIDNLRMHLDYAHSHVKYSWEMVKEEENVQFWQCILAKRPEVDKSVPEWSLKRRRRVAIKSCTVGAILAPTRSFDSKAFLDEEDESWDREARLDRFDWLESSSSSSDAENGDPSIEVETQPVRDCESPVSQKRYSPEMESILARPKPPKKRYKVPVAAKGVTFFRLFTKRPLQDGEEISGSDDDINIDWIQSKRNAEIAKNPNISTSATKRFMICWNQFLDKERLQSDCHLGDALLRFAHEKTRYLRKEGLFGEFERAAEDLLSRRLISQKTHSKVTSLAADVADGARVYSEDKASDRKDKSHTHGMAQLTLQSPSNAPQSEVCLCGSQALMHSGRAIVYCESIFCVRHAFHIDCVKRVWRPRKTPDLKGEWYCKECVEDPDIDTGACNWH